MKLNVVLRNNFSKVSNKFSPKNNGWAKVVILSQLETFLTEPLEEQGHNVPLVSFKCEVWTLISKLFQILHLIVDFEEALQLVIEPNRSFSWQGNGDGFIFPEESFRFSVARVNPFHEDGPSVILSCVNRLLSQFIGRALFCLSEFFDWNNGVARLVDPWWNVLAERHAILSFPFTLFRFYKRVSNV